MDRTFSFSAKTTFVLAILSLCWLVFDIVVLTVNYGELLLYGYWSIVASTGYLVILAFHIAAFSLLVMHFRKVDGNSVLRAGAFAAGILSLLALCTEKVFYDEIARDFAAGFAVHMEFAILIAMLAFNAVFSVYMIFFVYRIFRTESAFAVEVKDEKVFLLAQYMGVVCGLSGLYMTLSLIGRQVPLDRFWIYLPMYALLIFPYGVTVLYWLIMKARERIGDWYDEKQLQDLMKAALTTLLLSIPGQALLLLADGDIAVYWYSSWLFMTLMLFSGSTLYYFRHS